MSATTGTRWPPLPTMAGALKDIYTAPSVEAAETALLASADSTVGKRYTAAVATRPRFAGFGTASRPRTLRSLRPSDPGATHRT